MAVSTKEQIASALRTKFKTKEIQIAEGVFIGVREISPAAERAIREKCWERGTDGEFIVIDKAGNVLPKGSDGNLKPIPGTNFRNEWLSATVIPVEAVEEIMSNDVHDSVREEIFSESRAINGYEVKAEAIAKNSTASPTE